MKQMKQMIKLNLITPYAFPSHVDKHDKALLRTPSKHEEEFFQSLLTQHYDGKQDAFHKYQETYRHVALHRLPYVQFEDLYHNIPTVELVTRAFSGRKFNNQWLNEQVTVAEANQLYVKYHKATINDGRSYIRLGDHARTSLGRFLSHTSTSVNCDVELDIGNGVKDAIRFDSVLGLKNFIESSCLTKTILGTTPDVCRYRFNLLQKSNPTICGTQDNTDAFIEYAYWRRLKAVPEMMELFIKTSLPFVVTYLNFDHKDKERLDIYVHIEQENRHVSVLTSLREKLKANPNLEIPVPKLNETQLAKYGEFDAPTPPVPMSNNQ